MEASHIFKSLNTLNLNGNQLFHIPIELENMLSLKKLNMSKNLLGGNNNNTSSKTSGLKIQHNMKNNEGCDRIKSMHSDESTTNIHGNHTSTSDTVVASNIPPSIQSLDISRNKLNDVNFLILLESTLISQDGGRDKKLNKNIIIRELLVNFNHITIIPKCIIHIERLRELQLSQNQIVRLDNLNLQLLKELEILNLSDNQIVDINIRFPISITTLMLTNNNITDIPNHLVELQNLQVV